LEASVAMEKSIKALFKPLIEAAICLVVNSTGLKNLLVHPTLLAFQCMVRENCLCDCIQGFVDMLYTDWTLK
jgi:hypothetical protein